MFQFDPDRLYFFILTYPIFLFALSFHEMAHAITAKWGGDLTSAYQGRITLNPISHIDPVGTILMPILMAISTGIPLIGWAKPVPIVETNFRRGSNYAVIVALAGPFSNLVLALATVALTQLYIISGFIFGNPDGGLFGPEIDRIVLYALYYAIAINLFLMFFNLLPVPPLDGSHALWHWVIKPRPHLHELFFTVARLGFFILILLIFIGAIGFLFRNVVYPILMFLFELGTLNLI